MNLNKKFFVTGFLLAIFGSILFLQQNLPNTVSAAATAANCNQKSDSFLGFPTWYKYLDPQFHSATGNTPAECSISFDPLAHPGDAGKIGLAIAELMLRIAGTVSVGFVVYGGIRFILSQGDTQKAVTARHTIINAMIGLVISSLAVVIVQLVGGSLK